MHDLILAKIFCCGCIS